jgi:hypothetical protein
MTRKLLVGCISSLAILSVFPACGKAPEACDGGICATPCNSDNPLNDKAYLCSDRASLGFAQEFNSGTFIGQRPQETLSIRNMGLESLVVESATLSGDSAFTLTTEPATLPATVPGKQYFLARVVFAPTQAKQYVAKLTVVSNAENAPSQEFEISGCGVPTDGGASPCYRADAGAP